MQTARYMQFVVALQLKIAAHVIKKDMGLPERYSPANLKSWFGSAAREHPFELIHAYLGQLAHDRGDEKTARKSFRNALIIPPPASATAQVTIEAIRAQILVRWALCLKAAGDEKTAREKIRDAVSIMERIGTDPNYRPVFRLQDGRPADGWFKDGYEALCKAADTMDLAACQGFLRCFTFNYW